jgi:aminodeoxyfutalosine deaminase
MPLDPPAVLGYEREVVTKTTPSDVLARMPKAELHVHLEGTITPEALWRMSLRNQVALPARSLDELRRLYQFTNFDLFLDLWLAMCRCFRTEADYRQMADDFIAECRRQNIRYSEAHFTAFNHERFGIGGRRALEVVTERLQTAEAEDGVVARLIVDIPADCVAESGPYTIELLEKIANPLVVAIGLGGPEVGFPRKAMAKYFERARSAGYAAVAHAGETAGAQHVREAIIDLRARRIQHGIRAIEDPGTVALLRERDVCCDIALTSNRLLTTFRDLNAHPIRMLADAKVPLTLSTDDPPFFGTDLVREYCVAHSVLKIDLAALWQMNLNGLRYGLADIALRRRLMMAFLDEGRNLGLEASPMSTSV